MWHLMHPGWLSEHNKLIDIDTDQCQLYCLCFKEAPLFLLSMNVNFTIHINHIEIYCISDLDLEILGNLLNYCVIDHFRKILRHRSFFLMFHTFGSRFERNLGIIKIQWSAFYFIFFVNLQLKFIETIIHKMLEMFCRSRPSVMEFWNFNRIWIKCALLIFTPKRSTKPQQQQNIKPEGKNFYEIMNENFSFNCNF